MELDEMRITEFLAEEIYSENKYISTARGVYQIRYSPAQHRYFHRKLFSPGFAKPGEIRPNAMRNRRMDRIIRAAEAFEAALERS